MGTSFFTETEFGCIVTFLVTIYFFKFIQIANLLIAQWEGISLSIEIPRDRSLVVLVRNLDSVCEYLLERENCSYK